MEKHYQIIDQTIIYDFELTMKFLSKHGQSRFGEHFSILKSDTPILRKLMIYAIRDEEMCLKHHLNLNKGILLLGPVGCGKTSFMQLFNLITPKEKQYPVRATRDISSEFIKDGYEVLHKYGKAHKVYCFDDLGVEQSIKHFGNECNVMGEILLSRYDLLRNHSIITHATTNLNSDDLEKIYGNRVRSRLREMFNLISFPESCKDKRK